MAANELWYNHRESNCVLCKNWGIFCRSLKMIIIVFDNISKIDFLTMDICVNNVCVRYII